MTDETAKRLLILLVDLYERATYHDFVIALLSDQGLISTELLNQAQREAADTVRTLREHVEALASGESLAQALQEFDAKGVFRLKFPFGGNNP